MKTGLTKIDILEIWPFKNKHILTLDLTKIDIIRNAMFQRPYKNRAQMKIPLSAEDLPGQPGIHEQSKSFGSNDRDVVEARRSPPHAIDIN